VELLVRVLAADPLREGRGGLKRFSVQRSQQLTVHSRQLRADAAVNCELSTVNLARVHLLLGRLSRAFLLGDEHFPDDADVSFPPMAALDGAVRKGDRAMGVHVGPSLAIRGDGAQEGNDFRFLVEQDLLLAQPSFDIAPAEDGFVDRPEPGEMAILDAMLFSKFGHPGHDFVALGKVDPERTGALAEVGDPHSGGEPFPRTSPSRDVALRRRLLGRRWLGIRALRAHTALGKDSDSTSDQER